MVGKTYFIFNSNSKIFIFYIQLFHADERSEAEAAAIKRRKISPKSYRYVRAEYEEVEVSHDLNDEPDITENIEKIEVQQCIQQQMIAMNNQFIELDDSEIEDVQEILREDDSNSEIGIEWEDCCSMPLPSTMKTEPNENTPYDIQNDVINEESVSENICSIGIC